MRNLLVKTTLLAFFTFILACSEDQTYDKKKAVLAFSDITTLEIDKSLENVEIVIPNQIQTSNYNTNINSENQEIENFFFSPKKNRRNKFLTKYKKIWTGYRSFYKGRFVFEPIIKDGNIYLLDARGILRGYELLSKKKIYKKRIFPKRYLKNYQSPKIGYANDQIFAIAGTNEIVSTDLKSGEILWRKKILSLPISTPISDKKFVYVTTNDSKTYALKVENGDLAWVSSGIDRPTAIFGSAKPVIHEDNIFVSYASGEIYALNKETGETLWSRSLNQNRAVNSDFYLNDIDSTPIIHDNTIFVVGNGGLMMAINIKNGKYIWKKEIASISDFWTVSDFIFVIDNQNRLISISQKTGGIKYISKLPHFKDEDKPQTKIIYNSIIMAGDKLLVSDASGKILIIDPQNGQIEQKFRFKEENTHSPIIINGKIYIHALSSWTTSLIEIR